MQPWWITPSPVQTTNTVPWVTVTLQTLDSYLVDAQLQAYNSAALATGQTDRFTQILNSVIFDTRQNIQASKRYLVSQTANSVPPEAIWMVAWIILDQMQAAIPGMIWTDDQRKLIDRAYKKLDRIRSGDEVVSYPPDPMTPQNVEIAPPGSSRDRLAQASQ